MLPFWGTMWFSQMRRAVFSGNPVTEDYRRGYKLGSVRSGFDVAGHQLAGWCWIRRGRRCVNGFGLALAADRSKVAAIGWTTSKEALSQPLFYVLLAIGVLGLFLFPFIPYNTLGEDIKMVKGRGADVDHGPLDHHGVVDGQLIDRRRNRRPNRPDLAVKAGWTAAVHSSENS